MQPTYHFKYMELAIYESLKGAWSGFIPVGAVLVCDNQLVFKGHNLDRFQHVELIIGNYIFGQLKDSHRKKNYTLYVTQEPCVMCWYAIHNMPIQKVYFGTFNELYGGLSNKIEWSNKKAIEVFGGIKAETTSMILQSFFQGKKRDK